MTAQEFIEKLRTNLHKVIVGQDDIIDQILVAFLADGHVLLEGVPGTAKTLLVKTLTRILGAQFSRIQFTPDLMPADITGTSVFNLATSTFTLRKGPIFSDFVLADEVNRTPPKTQAALLEAMEERQVTIDGERFPLSPYFMVLATQNPIEHEGIYPLPEAQLDRFLMKVLIPYPALAEEQQIISNYQQGFDARRLDLIELDRLADIHIISQLRAEVRQTLVEEGVQRYIVELVRNTRDSLSLGWGASPRAGVALLLTSKALAVLRGRHFVTPDDVKELAKPVLRHRILLRSEAEIEGITPDDVIEKIVTAVEIPR